MNHGLRLIAHVDTYTCMPINVSFQTETETKRVRQSTTVEAVAILMQNCMDTQSTV